MITFILSLFYDLVVIRIVIRTSGMGFISKKNLKNEIKLLK